MFSRPAEPSSTSGAGRRSSSPRRSRCRSASRRARSTPSSSGRSTSRSRSSGWCSRSTSSARSRKRRERHLYVAIWFYIATHRHRRDPPHLQQPRRSRSAPFKSYSIYAGVQDALMQWWYGHNAVAFFLTTPFLGSCTTSCRRRRSGRSSRTGCRSSTSGRWSSSTSGPARTTCTTPRCRDWASTLGMVFCVMLWMPSWGGMINGLLTLRGAWDKVVEDPVLKFFVVGVTFYGMATFEGPLLSIKSVNALVALHRLDHRPRARRRARLERLHDVRHVLLAGAAPLPDAALLARSSRTTHFWVATFGILLYVVAMYSAGRHAGPHVARVRRDRPPRSIPTSSRP